MKTLTITVAQKTHQWQWPELWNRQGIRTLDQIFLQWLQLRDSDCYEQLLQWRQEPGTREQVSEWAMMTARHVEDFILTLLPEAKQAYQDLVSRDRSEQTVVEFSQWAQTTIKRPDSVSAESWQQINQRLARKFATRPDPEYGCADIWAAGDSDLKKWVSGLREHSRGEYAWQSFKIPYRIDHQKLFSWQTDDVSFIQKKNLRVGFKWTDKPISPRFIQQQVHYCLHCHVKQGDFCSIGFPVKKKDISLGYRQNPLGELLLGCPLEQHISEMMVLRTEYRVLAACAMIMIENPLYSLTGQKICNDCMKACVYQKQEPVDIPKVETQTLKGILSLPWGAEIIMLLMSWNPCRIQQYLPQEKQQKSVAVMGAGPSGIAMSYHLLMAGLTPVLLDGLRIEPLSQSFVQTPIHAFEDLCEPLEKRQPQGFGGVAEYGITVRWDKNLLLISRLFLARWGVQTIGQVRFGGTVTIEDIWQLGFHHLVLALGAGLPRALHIKNSLAPGMMSASDFLMNLQLNGASLEHTWSLMPIRMPVIVIGAGLTAVDAATEARAYYIALIQRFQSIWLQQLANRGQEIWGDFTPTERDIIKEWLDHAEQLKLHGQEECLRRWGDVTIVYRQAISQSPAYRTNHAELADAMREGVLFREHTQPQAVICDKGGWLNALRCINTQTSEETMLAAGTVIVATGQQPNVAYGYEHQKHLQRSGSYYKVNDAQGQEVGTGLHAKSQKMGFFAESGHSQHQVSIIGDLHPVFHGSVVKAIASAKRAYPDVIKACAKLQPGRHRDLVEPSLVSCQIFGEDTLITVLAPLQSKNAQYGQLYRCQPFSSTMARVLGKQTHVEPLTARVWDVDRDQGLLTLSMHGLSPCLAVIHGMMPGEGLSLMGPTGVRMRIPTVPEVHWLISDSQGLCTTMSLVRAYQQAGCAIVLLLHLDPGQEVPELFWQGIERDKLTFYQLSNEGLPNDMSAWLHALPEEVLAVVERVIIQGKPAWLRQWSVLQAEPWQKKLRKCQKITGSVQGNAQCLLKGICARCLQWQIDPQTGRRTKAVFACSWQDQPLEMIDLDHLQQRDAVQSFVDKCQGLFQSRSTESISSQY